MDLSTIKDEIRILLKKSFDQDSIAEQITVKYNLSYNDALYSTIEVMDEMFLPEDFHMPERFDYYHYAEEYYRYLKVIMSEVPDFSSNRIAALEQETCEKYLKHVIYTSLGRDALMNVVHTRSLHRLLEYIKENLPTFKINQNLLLQTEGFYPYVIYPCKGAFNVGKDEVLKAFDAVEEAKKAVDRYVGCTRHEIPDTLETFEELKNGGGHKSLRDQPMDKIKEIADKADMIVNGYAFTRENDQIKIVYLHNLVKAVVISEDGEVLATTMDDVQMGIVLAYWNRNKEYIFMDDEDMIEN